MTLQINVIESFELFIHNRLVFDIIGESIFGKVCNAKIRDTNGLCVYLTESAGLASRNSFGCKLDLFPTCMQVFVLIDFLLAN